LIEAAGGGSNFMFGMAGFMRDIKAVVMENSGRASLSVAGEVEERGG
jgi:hypothetical protein